MFKLLSLLICVLGLTFAAEAPSADAKGCHPHNHGCCGCDTSRSRSQVRVLTNNLFENLASFSGQDAFVSNFLVTSSIQEILPFCPDADSCCIQTVPASNMWIQFSGSIINFFINAIQLTREGNYVVKGLATSSRGAPTFESQVFDYEMTWVPSIGCNWKVNTLNIVSRSCPLNTTLACNDTECNSNI